MCVISVFVQRRNTDEEMLFRDFCVQLPPDKSVIKSDKNNTNTTSEGQSCFFDRCAVKFYFGFLCTFVTQQ